MSNYIVSKRYKDSFEPKKEFEDLKEALAYCIHYDSLCQDNTLDMVVTNKINDMDVFSIDQHGFYNVNDAVNRYELKVISDFIKDNLEGK